MLGGNGLTHIQKKKEKEKDSKLTAETDLSSMTFSSCCHNIVRMSQLLDMLQIKVTPRGPGTLGQSF